MRPVDKGNSPYSEIDEYQEAEAYLEKQIGSYCSFCEMPICNAPAVEHKDSKNIDRLGQFIAWLCVL